MSKQGKVHMGGQCGAGRYVHQVSISRVDRNQRGLFAGLTLVATAMVLASCGSTGTQTSGGSPRSGSATPPTPKSVLKGSYVRTVSMGGLRITPPRFGTTGEHLGLSWGGAETLFEATSAVQGSHTNAILGFGLVAIVGSPLPPGTPPLDGQPAWVGITWGGVTSCPAELGTPKGSSSTNRTHHQIFPAVVIYGVGGKGALVYTSRGDPPCGGAQTGPTVAEAKEVLSVPWHQTTPLHSGRVQVSYQAPNCAALFSTSAYGNIRLSDFHLTVEVTAPFDYASCPLANYMTSIQIFPPAGPGPADTSTNVKLSHGSTGLISVLDAGQVTGAPSATSASPAPKSPGT